MKRSTAAAKAVPQVNDLQSLDVRIEREQEILSRLAEAKREVQAASEEETAARTKLREAEMALNGTRSSLTPENTKHLSPGREAALQERLVQEQALVTSLQKAHEASERRVVELNEEITRLATVDLPACQAETPVGAVVEHQSRVAEAAANLREIDSLITAQERSLAALSFEDIEQYEVRLQDILADRALGKVEEAEFARREAEIIAQRDAAKQTNKEGQLSAATARRTIEGIETRRRAAEQELAGLEASSKSVIAHFLRSEMEQFGAEYVEKALSLKSLFIRIAGLARLARTYDGAGKVLHDNWADNFRLPALRVQACQGLEHPNWRGVLFSAEFGNYNSLWSDAMEAERARIRALGVDL